MIEAWIVSFALLLARTTAFWFVVPVFGGRQSPHTVKIGLSFALCFFWLSGCSTPPAAAMTMVSSDLGVIVLAIATVREVLIGLCLGLAFEVFVIPAKIAGTYLAQELGLNLAAMADPTSTGSSDVMANITQAMAILMCLSFNLHHLMVMALDRAMTCLPVGGSLPNAVFQLEAAGMIATVSQGLQIIAPLAVALLVVLAGLFILARAVPSFNLFSVGLSVRLLAGLGLIMLLLPQLIHNIQWALARGRFAIGRIFESL